MWHRRSAWFVYRMCSYEMAKNYAPNIKEDTITACITIGAYANSNNLNFHPSIDRSINFVTFIFSSVTFIGGGIK